MSSNQTVVDLFQTYHKDLQAPEINTQHYVATDIIENLREYLIEPGTIVKGVAGVGRWPYVGFVTKIGIAIIIKTKTDAYLHFIADPVFDNNTDVLKILGCPTIITQPDQLVKLTLHFITGNI